MDDGVIVILATLDTKGEEAQFLVERVRASGQHPWIVDTGIAGQPSIAADTDRGSVAKAAGLDTLVGLPKGEAMAAAARGALAVVMSMVESGRARAIIGIGGGQGSWLATSIMRELPIGFPKVMVSTTPSPYGDTDIISMPSITDFGGLNFVLRPILANAAASVSGMAAVGPAATLERRPRIAMTMFGVTTPGVTSVRKLLQSRNLETVVFHANGAGGRSMERYIRAGEFDAVVDMTTTEITDELVGGFLGAGADRLTAAGAGNIPQVVVPGAIDIVNFGEPETLPSRFAGRLTHMHTPATMLMRSTAAENVAIARFIADKLNRAIGPVAVVVPERGFSILAGPGGPFEDPEADQAFIVEMRRSLRADIPMTIVPCNINDSEFAVHVVEALEIIWPSGMRTELRRT